MATDSTGGDRGNGAAQPALLTVRQAADMLTVSTRKVYNLITEGKLPHYRIDNAIRVAVADVEDYLADCRITCPPVVEPLPEAASAAGEEASRWAAAGQDFPSDDRTSAACSAASRRCWDFWARWP